MADEPSVGSRLRERREALGLSLGQVGEYEGISPQYLSRLELGVNHPAVWPLLARLARRYRCSADYLLGLTDDPRPASGESLPTFASETLEVMRQLSGAGREELCRIAQVMLEQSQRQAENVRTMNAYLDTIEALGGEELLNQVVAALRLAAGGEMLPALAELRALIAVPEELPHDAPE